jgi:hypothetical protein
MSDTLLREIRKMSLQLERIEKAMKGSEKKKESWVKVSTVTRITGWNKEQLRQARVNGILERKKEKDGFWYKLESIPEVYLKK